MITFSSLSFSYGDSEKMALENVFLEIAAWEFVLVSGLSGSGKSTLLKAINGLVPHFYGGKYRGNVHVGDCSVKDTPVAQLGGIVGMVFQDSSAQIVAETVDEEIAFGPANMGISDDEITDCVTQAAQMLGIEDLLGRRTATLSGGEKQKVAIAAVIGMRPRVLVLDEPLAELDEASADGLIALLTSLNREGMTVIIAEHRVDRLLKVVDRVIEVANGRISDSVIASGRRSLPAGNAGGQSQEGDHGRLPRRSETDRLAMTERHDKQPPRKDTLISIKNLSFSFKGRAVFNGFDMAVREGEIVALTGANGCGKTTLLRLICGFLAPERGDITVAGLTVGQADRTELFRQIGYVPQRPSALLFAESVEDEVYVAVDTGRLLRRPADSDLLAMTYNDNLLEEFGLSDVRGEYPRDLSWGQQQRVALAAVLAKDPPVILLDEPTHGLDAGAKTRLAQLLKTLAARGAAVIIATHDKEMAAMAADRIIEISPFKRLTA